MKNPTWSIVVIIVVAAVLVGIAIGGNPQTENDPEKADVSGKVETVTPETKPVRIDFIKENSNDRLSAPLSENGEYSIQLDPGRYRVELSYTTIGDVISPIPGFCGVYQIDSDNDNLDFRC